MIMIITAMILATGPSMDSRIDWSGASQGMDEPAAWAAGARDTVTKVAKAAVAMWRRRREACWIMTGLLRGSGCRRGWRRAWRPARRDSLRTARGPRRSPGRPGGDGTRERR